MTREQALRRARSLWGAKARVDFAYAGNRGHNTEWWVRTGVIGQLHALDSSGNVACAHDECRELGGQDSE